MQTQGMLSVRICWGDAGQQKTAAFGLVHREPAPVYKEKDHSKKLLWSWVISRNCLRWHCPDQVEGSKQNFLSANSSPVYCLYRNMKWQALQGKRMWICDGCDFGALYLASRASMMPPEMAVPKTPARFGPMACMIRKFWRFSCWPTR